jgi:hypothetical protein
MWSRYQLEFLELYRSSSNETFQTWLTIPVSINRMLFPQLLHQAS